MTWLRGARCTDPEEMPEKEARPRPKIATVERREASASRWTRAAPRQAWPVARHERDNRRLAPFGAPLAPHGGGWNRGKAKPGRSNARRERRRLRCLTL